MYRNLTIERFRGIERLEIPALRRLNLILGLNNAGKTSVLEAVMLLCAGTNPFVTTTLGQLRGQRILGTPIDALWRPLFFRFEPDSEVSVSGRWDNEVCDRNLRLEAMRSPAFGEAPERALDGNAGVIALTEVLQIRGLVLRYRDGSNNEFETQATYDIHSKNISAAPAERLDVVRSTLISARASSFDRDTQQFSRMVRSKGEQAVVEAMRIIEPRLQRIEVLSEPGGSSVYVDVGLPSLIPLASCGEGFVRLFSIIVEVTASRGGVLLIDEIDNGLHHSVMKKLWNVLRVMCEQHDVQLFATTHNEELIFTALDALEDDYSCLAMHRLDRGDNEHRCATYTDELLAAVKREHFEIRGGE